MNQYKREIRREMIDRERVEIERVRDIEVETERERERERGESKREGGIPYVIFLFSSQKIVIFSAFSRFCLDISKKKFRTCLLTSGRPIFRAF